MGRKLSRAFTIAQWLFKPAPTGTTEKRRRVHRLRLPLKFDGKDPAAVLDFASRVRGEDLHATVDMKDGKPPVEFIGRLEGAGVKLAKGKKKAPVTLALLIESEDVTPIAAVLDGAVRAARAELLEVQVTLQQLQGELPGLEEDATPELGSERLDEAGGEDGEDGDADYGASARQAVGGEHDADGAPAGEVLAGPGSKKKRGRRPKGSSPAPRT